MTDGRVFACFQHPNVNNRLERQGDEGSVLGGS